MHSLSENDDRVLYNLGLIYSLQGNHEAALAAYDKVLVINPRDLATLVNKSSTYNDTKKYLLALETLEKVIQLSPEIPEAWSNRGIALNNLNLHEEAIESYSKAIRLRPNYYEAWSNKSVPLSKLKRFLEASESCEQALSINPDYAEGFYNKGNALKELKRFDEAITHYDKAISLKPDYHEAAWNKSLSLLLLGDFERGLPLYECRWQLDGISEKAGRRTFDKPTWLGLESLKSKTILLYGEQGFGDFIQFSVYVKHVSELGADVILEVPKALAGLMRNIDGVKKMIIKGQELPPFDYQCPLLSLPLALNARLGKIPSINGLMKADDEKNQEWERKLGSKLKPRIGLVWSGNSTHPNDKNRSFLLQNILPYLPNQFEYVSLQKEVREADKLILQANPQIKNIADELHDFEDTAAAINAVDLVVTVDTSVAHLSGALGKKTLVLLPYVPDWRWLLDRPDSPWYPTIKLYRQKIIDDWSLVFCELKKDLDELDIFGK